MISQEETREEVLQQAIMALARAVQQMESKSLARLDDLDARLVSQQQPDSEAPGELPPPPLGRRLSESEQVRLSMRDAWGIRRIRPHPVTPFLQGVFASGGGCHQFYRIYRGCISCSLLLHGHAATGSKYSTLQVMP